jgi:cysteinyl-tRNA synthetase
VTAANGSSLQQFREQCREELCNDFNWSKVVVTIFAAIAKRLTGYIDSRDFSAHPLVIMHAIDEISSFLGVFGFSQQQRDQTRPETTMAITEAIKFRGKVRALGLEQLKIGNIDAAKETLELCDEFRTNLGTCGISIKVYHFFYFDFYRIPPAKAPIGNGQVVQMTL